tara:strand:+ start:3943 stop:4143 length:201 start_codon:yes stop_codon:yes gene_type:complete
MAEVDYSQMDGVSVLWHMISTGDPGFLAILGLGIFFMIFSLVYDKYFEDEEISKAIKPSQRDHGQY